MTVFARARWAVGVAIALAIGAGTRYPGGTPLDPSSKGYSISHNFLSDLGMTVAYNDQANRLGAFLFVASLGILVVGLGGCLVGVVKLYSRSPGPRRLARAAGVVGLLVCAAFVGVAATPENRVMALHVSLTLLGWRTLPVVSLLLFLASLSAPTFPRRVAVTWAALTVVLVGYVIVLGWGPPASVSAEWLVIQVAAQKLVAATAVGIFSYLSVEADRASAAART
jgi:hypothetical membrane protein